MLEASIQKVFLARPRGFCAGVSRAVNVVEDCLDIFGTPVYIKHEIVHNKTVVGNFEKRGAITIEDISDVPNDSVVIFSAHGSPPEEYAIARAKNCTIIDATCPLVNKVHLEAHRFLKDGYSIVYIGHKGHPEGIGVLGEALSYNKTIPLIETVSDIDHLSFDKEAKLAYLTQTTLSVSETETILHALKEKFPNIVAPPARDICYATTNRQHAVQELSKISEAILIIGSKNSSNSNRLAETARASGKPAYLIDGVEDINNTWFEEMKTIGISAGASAPETCVQEVTDYFKRQGAAVEEFIVTNETIQFTEPLELIKIKQMKKP